MADREKKVTIGIDLGGTAVKIGIVDEAYELLAQTSIPTGAERPYEQVIADMGMAAAALLQENGWRMEDCLGVGAGCPGTIDSKNGVVLYSNNIRWDNVPAAQSWGISETAPNTGDVPADVMTVWKLMRRLRR